ncbi:unnamed protein product [Ophioblennius macclurei]
MKYHVKVYGLRSEGLLIDLCDTEEQMKSMTVWQLKEKIFQRLPEYRHDGDHLKMLFRGEVLDEDEKPLSEYGVQHKSAIHVILRVPEGGGGS